jgi:hypothetical protein
MPVAVEVAGGEFMSIDALMVERVQLHRRMAETISSDMGDVARVQQ